MKNNVFAIERKRIGLTQEQLAKKLNTSRSNVANWENGQNMPSIDLLFKCSNLFDCDVMYLAGYQNERKEKSSNYNIPEPDFNHEESDDISLLKSLLKKNGFLNKNEDFSKENLDTLLKFIKANKSFIMNNDKEKGEEK